MMWLPRIREWVEWSSEGIQTLAVAIIVFSIILGSLRFLLQLATKRDESYQAYKVLLGRALLLALEFMVAADVIRTVLFDLTAKGLEILAGLVAIRPFLSWSVTVDLEGRWPGQSAVIDSQPQHEGGTHARKSIFRSVDGHGPADDRPLEISVYSAAFGSGIPGDPQRS